MDSIVSNNKKPGRHLMSSLPVACLITAISYSSTAMSANLPEPDVYLEGIDPEEAGLCSLDVDGNGVFQKDIDGALLRDFFRGQLASRTRISFGSEAQRTSPDRVVAFLQSEDCRQMLDLDGNGEIQARFDGKILARWLDGLTGPALVNDALGQGGERTDVETVRTQLEYFTNPRRRFGGQLDSGSTAGIRGAELSIKAVGRADVELQVTVGQDHSGVPIYEILSKNGKVQVYLPDPNQYGLESQLAPILSADESSYPPRFLRETGMAWFAKIGPGFNRYPGPVDEDANEYDKGAKVDIPPGVYPTAVTLTAKPAFKLMDPCAEVDPDACDYKGMDAVLFVHGDRIASDLKGGGYNTWGEFPALMQASGYIPFEFRWSTSARMQDSAQELAQAVQQITERTGKQVHIIAHSYGGVLTRTLLQGLARGKPDVNERVASFTTLGTPHSGIMDDYTCRKGLGFPRGQDDWTTEGCNGIPCHQMGEKVFSKVEAKFYKLKPRAGHHAALLDDNLAQDRGTDPIPTQSLIGLTMKRGNDKKIDGGDGLITLEGQRFRLQFSANSSGCDESPKVPGFTDKSFKSAKRYGPFKLTESFLGNFDSGDRPGDKVASKRGGGYRHSEAVDGAGPGEKQPPSEPYVTCDSNAPGSCSHDGFQKSLSWVNQHPAQQAGFPLDGFGDITGECGVIGAAELDSPLPLEQRNTLDFGSDPYGNEDYDSLSPGGQAILDAGNPGSSALLAEVFAFEQIHRCYGAELLKTKDEIIYLDAEGKKTDILVEIAGRTVGVESTRAASFPPGSEYTQEQALALLEDSLNEVKESSANVGVSDAWVKQILHIFAYNANHADVLLQVYATLDAGLKADTIVLITVSEGDDGFLY